MSEERKEGQLLSMHLVLLVTTHWGCFCFLLCCWFSFKPCLYAVCCLLSELVQNKCFFLHAAAKGDHSRKEAGRKKQRLHGCFLTHPVHLHLSIAVLEITKEALVLIFHVPPTLSHLIMVLKVSTRVLYPMESQMLNGATTSYPQEPYFVLQGDACWYVHEEAQLGVHGFLMEYCLCFYEVRSRAKCRRESFESYPK